jgi:hypothetical protein
MTMETTMIAMMTNSPLVWLASQQNVQSLGKPNPDTHSSE